MSLARRLVPTQTHTFTRRTARRCFFLRPDERVNQTILFALGRALEKHDVELHGGLFESNHSHLCATDAGGEASAFPDFLGDFHSLVARALNAHYGRGENLWAVPGSYDNVEVHDTETLEEQLVYQWSNPVKDGLVEWPEEWPGVKFLPEDFGRTFTVQRPEGSFFGGRRPDDWEPTFGPARAALRRARLAARRGLRRGRPGASPPKERAPSPERRDRRRLPETVTFTIHPPPGYDHMTLEEVRAHFRRLLDARVAEIHRERREQGLTRYLGVDAVLAQDPLESAGDTFPTFGRNPRIACRDPAMRCALLAGLQEWRAHYRESLTAWRLGRRDVVFPRGAYALPVFHSARVGNATGPPALE